MDVNLLSTRIRLQMALNLMLEDMVKWNRCHQCPLRNNTLVHQVSTETEELTSNHLMNEWVCQSSYRTRAWQSSGSHQLHRVLHPSTITTLQRTQCSLTNNLSRKQACFHPGIRTRIRVIKSQWKRQVKSIKSYMHQHKSTLGRGSTKTRWPHSSAAWATHPIAEAEVNVLRTPMNIKLRS